MVTGSGVVKQIMLGLRQSIDLRRQIQNRCYPHRGDIQDYANEIHKTGNDVKIPLIPYKVFNRIIDMLHSLGAS